MMGPLECPHLAFLAWRGQAEVPPVAGTGDTLDDGEDAVTVALGIGEPLEHERCDPLSERDAVGAGVERAAPPRRRQGVDRCEQQVVVDAVVHVRPAADDHVAHASGELLARRVERGQRRGARRVDCVVDPAEVEPVGDPPGDDVGQHTGERVLGERRQVAVERWRERPDELPEPGAEAVEAAEVVAALGAEDHRRTGAIELSPVVTGVGERPSHDLQAEQLDGLDGGERAGRDPVGEGVERDPRQEATPLRRRLAAGVLGHGFGVVEDLRVPAVARHFGDAVDAVHHVGPELLEVGGAGEDGGHADDGDVDGLDRFPDLDGRAALRRRRRRGAPSPPW